MHRIKIKLAGDELADQHGCVHFDVVPTDTPLDHAQAVAKELISRGRYKGSDYELYAYTNHDGKVITSWEGMNSGDEVELAVFAHIYTLSGYISENNIIWNS